MNRKSFSAAIVIFLSLISQSIWADSVLRTIELGRGSAGVAANPRLNKIYVGESNGITVIDGQTDTIKSEIPSGRTNNVAVDVFTNRVYGTNCDFQTSSCRLVVIDGATDTVVTTIPIQSGQFIGIQGLAVNPVTSRIYLSDADNQLLLVMDGKSNSIIAQIPVGTQPSGVAVNPKTNRIYVGGGGFPGFIIVYDGATNSELARLQDSNSVETVATNFRLNRAYASLTSNVLDVIDGNTNQVVDTPATGSFPQGIDVNLFNAKVYVVNSNDSSVTIIDGNTDQVVQTLPIPAGFSTRIAVNHATGRSYVTDFGSTHVIVLQP